MPVAIGMLVHLFLDAMWADPETLWWPFLGFDFARVDAAGVGVYVQGVLGDWRVWALEVAGIVYLGILARRGGLTSAAARRALWSTGRIDVPIRSE
jgi:hypothetical protein